jgi:hypothetical protein
MGRDSKASWQRRAKVPLASIAPARIAARGAVEVRIAGTAKDGGPACAAVTLSAAQLDALKDAYDDAEWAALVAATRTRLYTETAKRFMRVSIPSSRRNG